MPTFDPEVALDRLHRDYSRRANAIRRDLGQPHAPDAVEQACERQNDEVLQALLAEAEEGLRQVARARRRLEDGTYGECQGCGNPIEPSRLAALPATEYCLGCAGRTH